MLIMEKGIKENVIVLHMLNLVFYMSIIVYVVMEIKIQQVEELLCRMPMHPTLEVMMTIAKHT